MTTRSNDPQRVAGWCRRARSATLSILLVLAATGGLGPASLAAPAPNHTDKSGDPLEVATAKLFFDSFGAGACSGNIQRSVVLWFFDDDKSPVPASAASQLHAELATQMLSAARSKCVNLRDTPTLQAELSKSGALANNGGNVIAALSEAGQNVDLVVFPQLFIQGGKTQLTMRAVERASGKTLAQTAQVAVPEKYLGHDAADQAVSLDDAIKDASLYLAGNAPDFTALRPLGIFFEDTGAQPPAGRYLLERVQSALVQDGMNVLTGVDIKLRSLNIEPESDSDGSVDAPALEPQADPSTYDLSGRYWILGNAVDLQLRMRRGDGTTVTWQRRIRTTDFDKLRLRPINPAAVQRPQPNGAFAFQVTSPKGTAPIYRVGDELKLHLRVGKDAWVYCFYVDSQGDVETVLPRNADPTGNRFAAKELHHLPDEKAPKPKRFHMRFRGDRLGEEMMVCFATSRDVRAELPAALFPEKFGNIPFLTLEKLRAQFAKLKDVAIAEASVTVTVAPKL
jgi:hypothetical protein